MKKHCLRVVLSKPEKQENNHPGITVGIEFTLFRYAAEGKSPVEGFRKNHYPSFPHQQQPLAFSAPDGKFYFEEITTPFSATSRTNPFSPFPVHMFSLDGQLSSCRD